MKLDPIDSHELRAAPVRRGVRLVALALLQHAEAAFARLSTNADEEALHDFRVALRRVRSHVRSYRPWLQESVKRKHERRLRRLARASNPSRDLEVLIELLHDLQPETALQRQGSELLVQRFQGRRNEADDVFRAEALHDFPGLSRELRVGLSTFLQPLDTESHAGERLASVAARLALGIADELRAILFTILTVEHQGEAHRARITGKKLRYLLEPFTDTSEHCAAAVDAFKQMQDAFGQLHDAHVLMTEAEAALADTAAQDRVALAALLECVRARRQTLFDDVRQRYIEPGAGLLLDSVRAAAREFSRHGSGLEVERKFLLRRMPRLRGAQELTIVQGYLPGSSIQERVRRIDSKEGTSYYRTLKAGQGVSRLEIEEETTQHIFRKLFALTKGRRVRKRRYLVEQDGVVWAVDRFLDRTLVLAEVELDSEADAIVLPRWLSAVLDREVTHDPEYGNQRLAR